MEGWAGDVLRSLSVRHISLALGRTPLPTLLRRAGKPVSDAVHGYLWEGDGHRGVAAKMAAADFTMHVHL